MNESTQYAHVAQQLFDAVREATAGEVGVTRESYGAGESRAIGILTEFARAEGFTTKIDRAGNVIYALPPDALDGPLEKPVLCGSHMDSVPEGGNFDGLAGVIAGLLCLMRQRDERRRSTHPLQVMALRGEESAWFGKAYIGSSALFGRLSSATLQTRHRSNGATLAACMHDVGADVDAIAGGEVLLGAQDVAGYVELHIEQGAVLDRAQRAVAIVPSIRGNVRYRNVRCIGQPGHSGAVPRAQRHDALFAAAYVVNALDAYWKRALADGADLVITCGVFGTRAEEHAISRIPGEVDFSFEARSASQEVLTRVLAVFERTLAETARSHGVRFDTGPLVQTAPAKMDPHWIALLNQKAHALNLPAQPLPSGAGHDAAMFAEAGIPSAMIFVRNQNGSHNPDEAMRLADFMDGFELLYASIDAFVSPVAMGDTTLAARIRRPLRSGEEGMNLTLAAALLARRGLGLVDIRQFAIQCRDGAREAGSESAALILLAEKATSFFDRYEGVAMSNVALHEFVESLAHDVTILRDAAAEGDTPLVEALNAFATALSSDVMI